MRGRVDESRPRASPRDGPLLLIGERLMRRAPRSVPSLTFGRSTMKEVIIAVAAQELTAVRTAETAGAIHHLAAALIAFADYKVGLDQ